MCIYQQTNKNIRYFAYIVDNYYTFRAYMLSFSKKYFWHEQRISVFYDNFFLFFFSLAHYKSAKVNQLTIRPQQEQTELTFQ